MVDDAVAGPIVLLETFHFYGQPVEVAYVCKLKPIVCIHTINDFYNNF